MCSDPACLVTAHLDLVADVTVALAAGRAVTHAGSQFGAWGFISVISLGGMWIYRTVPFEELAARKQKGAAAAAAAASRAGGAPQEGAAGREADGPHHEEGAGGSSSAHRRKSVDVAGG